MANKIINGKKYDTDTAVIKGINDNGLFPSGLFYEEMRLYQKKNGEFFLWKTDNIFTPLTEDEAKKWAEKYLDGDEYEEIFGPVEE